MRLTYVQHNPSGNFTLFHAGEDGVDVFQGLGFDVGLHQTVGGKGDGFVQILPRSDI